MPGQQALIAVCRLCKYSRNLSRVRACIQPSLRDALSAVTLGDYTLIVWVIVPRSVEQWGMSDANAKGSWYLWRNGQPVRLLCETALAADDILVRNYHLFGKLEWPIRRDQAVQWRTWVHFGGRPLDALDEQIMGRYLKDLGLDKLERDFIAPYSVEDRRWSWTAAINTLRENFSVTIVSGKNAAFPPLTFDNLRAEWERARWLVAAESQRRFLEQYFPLYIDTEGLQLCPEPARELYAREAFAAHKTLIAELPIDYRKVVEASIFDTVPPPAASNAAEFREAYWMQFRCCFDAVRTALAKAEGAGQ